MSTSEWMSKAACIASPGLPWTTDTDDLHRVPDFIVRVMLDTCATCPVRAECDAYATSEEVTGGWWAGVDRDLHVRLWASLEWDGDQGMLPLAFESSHLEEGRGAA